MKNYIEKLFTLCVVITVVTTLSLTSCYYDVQEELHPEAFLNNCDTGNSTYSSFVAPLLSSNCTSCHRPGLASAGIDLTVYSNVQAVANNGRLMGSINHATGYKAMPQNMPQLSSCVRNKMKAWINAGAQNN